MAPLKIDKYFTWVFFWQKSSNEVKLFFLKLEPKESETKKIQKWTCNREATKAEKYVKEDKSITTIG